MTRPVSTTRSRRLYVAEVCAGDLQLPDAAAHYLATVLRLGAGTQLTVFGGGLEADAEIIHASALDVRLRIGAPREAPALRDVTLVYAMSKGDKVDAVVRDAVELCATSIFIVEAERSIVKVGDDRRDKKNERWLRIAEEAARQSGRADTPSVEGPIAFETALNLVHSTHKFLLDPAAKTPLREKLAPILESSESIAFAVGPEGGFSQSEIEIASQRGFTIASFGKTTLRTETVPAAVLGALAVLGT